MKQSSSIIVNNNQRKKKDSIPQSISKQNISICLAATANIIPNTIFDYYKNLFLFDDLRIFGYGTCNVGLDISIPENGHLISFSGDVYDYFVEVQIVLKKGVDLGAIFNNNENYVFEKSSLYLDSINPSAYFYTLKLFPQPDLGSNKFYAGTFGNEIHTTDLGMEKNASFVKIYRIQFDK